MTFAGFDSPAIFLHFHDWYGCKPSVASQTAAHGTRMMAGLHTIKAQLQR